MTETRDPETAPWSQVAQRWIGILGLLVAPTTVITSLCFYFGYVFTRTYFAYFGVDTDAVGFTSSDYVLKSVSVLYGPIVVLLLVWVAVLWAGVYVRRISRSGKPIQLVRRMAWATITVGALGAAGGVVGVAIPRLFPDRFAAVTPLALGLGIILVVGGLWALAASKTTSAPRLYATAERTSLVAAAGLVVLALFWATNIFATAYGRNQAQIKAGKLFSQETNVVLDTVRSLAPPGDLIVESPLPSGDQAHDGNGFRYQCFRALAVHGDNWVLVPARWTPQKGYAVVVTADSANRISLNLLKGIADTQAADWNGNWRCPELAPPERLATLRK